MTEQVSPFITFYKHEWENYHQAIVKTIASLSSEQLALRTAPHYLSIGELLVHMVGARIWWFHMWMGDGDSDLAHMTDDEQAMYDAASLITMFEKTWHVISSALDSWTPDDLQQIILPPVFIREKEPPHTRQWIVWHVLEHEIHHGGELSLALGTHGLEPFYTW